MFRTQNMKNHKLFGLIKIENTKKATFILKHKKTYLLQFRIIFRISIDYFVRSDTLKRFEML